MADVLRSVGLDVGTTTTQLILSELTVENQASGFAVPHMQITDRKLIYQSPVLFTPLLGSLVDSVALRRWVQSQYAQAGIHPKDVDTGAIIITGETSRKENAALVLEELSGFAGEFVVATAGPHLESVLAAKGAGADTWSEQTGKRVLHMDIGGGTSNLALIENGRIVKTGCLNVGGRLLKFGSDGRITYVSPVLQGISDLRIGDTPTQTKLEQLCKTLTDALEMAAGLRPKTDLLDKLSTTEAGEPFLSTAEAVLSFSGGVADCIETCQEPYAFGDIGPLLGQAIKNSLLCRGQYRLGAHTIRATVIGAGCHSTSLSGSTVFYRGVHLPVKNLPVIPFTAEEQDAKNLGDLIAQRLSRQDSRPAVLAMPGYPSPTHGQIKMLAEKIVAGTKGFPVFVCLEQDMAKALGHALCLLLQAHTPCLCIDRLQLTEGSYLDIGTPVGPALPVVIKTLILSKE